MQTERDVSVRQRAVDLLYAMCDRSNSKQIVAEMLSYLETADYSIREEIVSVALHPPCPTSHAGTLLYPLPSLYYVVALFVLC